MCARILRFKLRLFEILAFESLTFLVASLSLSRSLIKRIKFCSISNSTSMQTIAVIFLCERKQTRRIKLEERDTSKRQAWHSRTTSRLINERCLDQFTFTKTRHEQHEQRLPPCRSSSEGGSAKGCTFVSASKNIRRIPREYDPAAQRETVRYSCSSSYVIENRMYLVYFSLPRNFENIFSLHLI